MMIAMRASVSAGAVTHHGQYHHKLRRGGDEEEEDGEKGEEQDFQTIKTWGKAYTYPGQEHYKS